MDFNAIKPKSRKSFTHDDHLICMAQARLFHLASKMHFDEENFTEKYMNSTFCNNHIDTECDCYQTSDTGYDMEVLLDEINPSKSKAEGCPPAMEYIGYMYQYLHIRSGVPSRELYGRLPYERMDAYCAMSINEDAEETLYSIMEDHGNLFPEVDMDE